VVDEVGLVRPDVAKRRREGAGWYSDVVRRERPDYLVIRLSQLQEGVSYAGASPPFRSLAERDSLLVPYEPAYPERGKTVMADEPVCLRRRR